jgi:hypothetical protein
MADELSATFERLRTSTQRLNNITDLAAQAIKDVEWFLEESGVGMTASALIHYTGHPDAEPEGWVNLEYRRVPGGKFRIAVVRVRNREREPEEESVRPWPECTREEKLESFQQLPALLAALTERIEERVAAAEKIIAEVAPSTLLSRKRKGGA